MKACFEEGDFACSIKLPKTVETILKRLVVSFPINFVFNLKIKQFDIFLKTIQSKQRHKIVKLEPKQLGGLHVFETILNGISSLICFCGSNGDNGSFQKIRGNRVWFALLEDRSRCNEVGKKSFYLYASKIGFMYILALLLQRFFCYSVYEEATALQTSRLSCLTIFIVLCKN